MSTPFRRLLALASLNNHDIPTVVKRIGSEHASAVLQRIMKPQESTVYIRSAAYVNNTAFQFRVPASGDKRLAILTEQARAALANGQPDVASKQIALYEPVSNEKINSDAELDVVLGTKPSSWLTYKVAATPGGDPKTKLRALIAETSAEKARKDSLEQASRFKATPATVDGVRDAVTAALKQLTAQQRTFPTDSQIRTSVSSQLNALAELGSENPVQLAAQISADLCSHIRSRANKGSMQISPAQIHEAVGQFAGSSGTWAALAKHVGSPIGAAAAPSPATLQKAWFRDNFTSAVYPVVPVALNHPTVTQADFAKHNAGLPLLQRSDPAPTTMQRSDPLAKKAAAAATKRANPAVKLVVDSQAAARPTMIGAAVDSPAVAKQEKAQHQALSAANRAAFLSFMAAAPAPSKQPAAATYGAAQSAKIGPHIGGDDDNDSSSDSDGDDLQLVHAHKEFSDKDRVKAAAQVSSPAQTGVATVKVTNRMTYDGRNVDVILVVGDKSFPIQYDKESTFTVPAGEHTVKLMTAAKQPIGESRTFRLRAGAEYSVVLYHGFFGNHFGLWSWDPLTALRLAFTSADMTMATGSARQLAPEGVTITLIDTKNGERTALTAGRVSVVPGPKRLEFSAPGTTPTVSKFHDFNLEANKGYVVAAGYDSEGRVWLERMNDQPLELVNDAKPVAKAAPAANPVQAMLGGDW